MFVLMKQADVLYHMYFRCFARRCSTHASVRMFQSDEWYAKYCLRYGLLASQPKLGLVDCNSRGAGDVNNATASESQLLARTRHASAGRRRLIIGR